MLLFINGKEKQSAAPATLMEIVQQFSKDPRHVITELNGAIVKSAQWEQTVLRDQDRIELVTFVGGG